MEVDGRLTSRRMTPELMDAPDADRAALADALRYLRSINHRLGGAKAALRQFKSWSANWPAHQTIRILDLGTGSADIPLAIANWARGAGLSVHITGVDLHPTTIALAREYIGERDDITLVQADALKLMDHFNASSFDYAHASLFLHHLADIEVLTVLRIMDRLTTRGVIWNDLVRGWIGKLGVRAAMLWPGVSPMAKHDGIVSVDAGFTRREALDLARRAGLNCIRYHTNLFYRFTLTSEK